MTHAGTDADLADRVLGGWLGRIAGNTLGKPVERGDHLTHGRIHGSCRDDDVDYAILGLHLLETHGFGFSTEQVGELWLLRLPYLLTFTAERAAYRNLTAGLKPPLTATHDNPYQEWTGALIRADIYGWTCPDAPQRAAYLARRDAVLSHSGNGVYGAMFAAALISAAFTAPTVRRALDTALTVIPPSCRLARAVRRVMALHETRLPWEDTLTTLAGETAGLGSIHTVPNVAVLTAGLLYGDGDFTRTITLTVRGGLDTGSNGATAGSVAGVLCGAAAIPSRWTDPLEDTVRSAVFGFDGARISELAARTMALGHPQV
ncbi:ADP-ribosylglycohydrolase family protein [Streptomyces geranii]|uniref:ADP-ribosylglycohydrolase family protein n=1 Tax=Streptomyces geranii TaxID=2058923 RepID=UPI000D036587|nr:ADP-ribosylglycohydrolase family protein [Streptomyces geranii]